MRYTFQRMLLILLAVVVCSAPFSPAQTSRRHKAKKTLAQPVVLPPMAHGPLPQVPMDQLPPVAPQVNYEQGALTIVAENSTLGDILREVRKRTGATIDVPQNANERVVTRLGPGPSRDVLASLLNGTSFNYVMMGSLADPAALSSVVLTPKPSGGAEPAQPVAEYQPPQPQYPMRPPGMIPSPGQNQAVTLPPQLPAPQAGADENADDSDDSADDNADDQSDAQPGAQPDPNAGAAPAGPQPNAGPKSPEQILQMLQRNQQQGQPQPPGTPPDNPQQQ